MCTYFKQPTQSDWRDHEHQSAQANKENIDKSPALDEVERSARPASQSPESGRAGCGEGAAEGA